MAGIKAGVVQSGKLGGAANPHWWNDLRVLIVKLSAMGDVVHCLPLAARIKERLPEVELTWLVEPAAQDLIKANPVVDRVLVLPRKSWLKALKNPATILPTTTEARKYFKELKAYNFNLAIDAQGLLKSAVPAYLSGAPLRVGFADTREWAHKFLTHALEVNDYFGHGRHVVDLNIALADYALEVLAQEHGSCLRLSFSDQTVRFPLPDTASSGADASVLKLPGLDRDFWAGVTSGEAPPTVSLSPSTDRLAPLTNKLAPSTELVSGAGQKQNPLIAIIPGTTWVTKIWPQEHWIALGRMLVERFGARLLICGGPGDATTNQSIYKGILSTEFPGSVKNLTGETSLMQLVALFKKCDLVVGADTGPLHLAAAVAHQAVVAKSEALASAHETLVTAGEAPVLQGVKPKVVAIHGATPWLRNGPYGSMGSTVHLNLPCQPCFSKTCRIQTLACLKDLPVGEVFQAVETILLEANSSS